MDQIPQLLKQIQATGDEQKITAAIELMSQYRAEALARPNAERVELLRVRLQTRLRETLHANLSE